SHDTDMPSNGSISGIVSWQTVCKGSSEASNFSILSMCGRYSPCEMDLRELFVYFVVLCSSVADAIRCKCTKESETVTCIDGICEMDPGSCLMLDHPTLGIHYTCHNKLQKDGFCREKTSKSGALVKICGCNSDDFCNYSYWPDKSATPDAPLPQRQAEDERVLVQNGVGSFVLFNAVAITVLITTTLYL
ncbi:hypothetical protein V3C99_002496, partial [Haemonchus contortus]